MAIANAQQVNAVLTTLNLWRGPGGNDFKKNSKSKLRDAVQGRAGFDLEV